MQCDEKGWIAHRGWKGTSKQDQKMKVVQYLNFNNFKKYFYNLLSQNATGCQVNKGYFNIIMHLNHKLIYDLNIYLDCADCKWFKNKGQVLKKD